jgi:O-antigen ligase
MDQTLLLFIYFLLFTFVTWYRFRLGLGLLFFLLPTYLLRFQVLGIPMTMLEGMILIIFIVWLFKELRITNYELRKTLISNLKFQITNYRTLFLASALFLLAATISIFTAVDTRAALGIWKAFFIEPFLLFIILISVFKQRGNLKSKICNLKSPTILIFPLVLSGLITSILAIYQHYTGWMVPWDFWENGNSYRVTGWYGFPNGLGLFLAPMVPLAIYALKTSFTSLRRNRTTDYGLQTTVLICSLLFIPCSLMAIIFAKSTGALVGVTAGIGLLLVLYKKTRWPSIISGLIGLIVLISPMSPLRDELLFVDRSGQIRLQMWGEAAELIRERPILGAGLASYQKMVKPYHSTVNGEGIEIFEHPHNIFLTMYVNLGILGLFGFLWIIVWFYRFGTQNLQATSYKLQAFLLASMTVILIHGLVDSPYIKNDLAIVFWLLIALMYFQSQTKQA